MAQRRPITSHPLFTPLVALWFAALFGLTVAVLPPSLIERVLDIAGLPGGRGPEVDERWIAIVAAALAGGAIGLLLGFLLSRRSLRDPRPIYAEHEIEEVYPVEATPVRRRPLRVREELAEEVLVEPPSQTLQDEVADTDDEPEPEPEPVQVTSEPATKPVTVEADEGFMILTPQPVHPPRPAPDLESLLEQFDSALAAFRSGDDARPARGSETDPVHAFVVRQTGSPVMSPLAGRIPDHQAELRAALDKLARAHRKD